MQEGNEKRRRGIVVGTAGHIDHGKTSLVRALTGVDTDRLAEEKRRGISIDLGFAHLDLADGKTISFVDVPGHERFIRNMLAGAAGIEAVMLIVAADEGIKPQTREHFEICRLLGIERGLVALTKVDLVSDGQLATARAAVETLVGSSFLAGAEMVPVSAVTGAGLDELRSALARLTERETRRTTDGFARLPVDRSFALKGFGTVVTGTLVGGKLSVGDSVTIYPLEKTARVRGLQVHGAAVETAFVGERTAVNLSGVEHSEIERGAVVATTNALATTRVVQVALQLLDDVEIEAREELLFHAGTVETAARLKMLSREGRALAEVQLHDAMLLLPGDRFVVRRPSPAASIGGGVVVEPVPPRRMSRAKTAGRLAKLADCDLGERVALLVGEKENGRKLEELVRLTGVPGAAIREAVAQRTELLYAEAAQRVVTRAWLESSRKRVLGALEKFHAEKPGEAGAPLASVRFALENALAAVVFGGMAGVRIAGDTIALANHKAQLNDRESAELARIEKAFREAAYQPPLAAGFARGPLERLIKAGRLVRISNELVFHADVIAHIRGSLAKQKGRRFSVAEFKDWMGISRKFAIPLLEYLDFQKVTQRQGEVRVVL